MVRTVDRTKEFMKKEVEPEVDKRLLKAGLVVERRAKRGFTNFWNVRTGRARGSISTATSTGHTSGSGQDSMSSFSSMTQSARTGSNVGYFKLLELGTSRRRPGPVLQTALADSQGDIKKIFA